eukprot:SAG31_NODE_670_length_12943_cov_18.029508_5_plen_89_part_00
MDTGDSRHSQRKTCTPVQFNEPNPRKADTASRAGARAVLRVVGPAVVVPTLNVRNVKPLQNGHGAQVVSDKLTSCTVVSDQCEHINVT